VVGRREVVDKQNAACDHSAPAAGGQAQFSYAGMTVQPLFNPMSFCVLVYVHGLFQPRRGAVAQGLLE